MIAGPMAGFMPSGPIPMHDTDDDDYQLNLDDVDLAGDDGEETVHEPLKNSTNGCHPHDRRPKSVTDEGKDGNSKPSATPNTNHSTLKPNKYKLETDEAENGCRNSREIISKETELETVKKPKRSASWNPIKSKSKSFHHSHSKISDTLDPDSDKDKSKITDTSSKKDHPPDTLPDFHGLRLCYAPLVYKNDYKNVLREIIAGVIVSFAQVVESIAFAMIAHVPSIFGLHSAWLIGGIVGLTGGRPAMISGATGGLGAILEPFMKDPEMGIDYLPFILIFSGVLIIILGIFNIGKFARLIPQTVMIGFLNGLAIIFLKSQMHLFEHAEDWIDVIAALVLALITFFVVQFLPRLTKVIPSSLAGIAVACLIEYLIIRMGFHHHTPLIGELNEIKGEWPQPFWSNPQFFGALPPLNSMDTWSKLIAPIALVTMVSIIEDGMTMDVVTELTHTKQRHLERHTQQQQISMGFANIIGGMMSTMGGHGAIGLSMVSCHSGSSGRYRISAIIAAVCVLIIVMFASPLIDKVPAAALVGIMFGVIFHTFEWKSIPMVISAFSPRKIRRKFPKCMQFTKVRRGDAIVIVLVTFLVVEMNLVYAVLIGVVLASLIYTWYSGFEFHVHKEYVHKHHLRDRRHIKKFSDFHIHYHRDRHRHGSHGMHSREHSIETMDSLDPHYHPPYHHEAFDEHHQIQPDDHLHSLNPFASHSGHLHRAGTFPAPSNNNNNNGHGGDNVTGLHQIKDIHHLDSFISHLHPEHNNNHHSHHHHEHHSDRHSHHSSYHQLPFMEPLKEADTPVDELWSPRKQKRSEQQPGEDGVDADKEQMDNDDQDAEDEHVENGHNADKEKEKTFHLQRYEHGTFNRLPFHVLKDANLSAECKLSDDEKLSDREDPTHHPHYEKLSDCTNPEDFAFGLKFNNDYILVYHFEGPLFFGNCRNLLSYFDPHTDPDHIEIHLRDACIYDFSAINSLNQVGEEYEKLGKTVHLRHIKDKSHKLIAKAHHLVKYFSYDEESILGGHSHPHHASYSSMPSTTRERGEREVSRSSLIRLTTPNQYRFRMNTRYV